ncbi:hypothetical protein HC864_05620 [Candidatus Gracilibacteria bacterium]|nr:hypothetical protein [Candidatus Gracilibacteria bacterium]
MNNSFDGSRNRITSAQIQQMEYVEMIIKFKKSWNTLGKIPHIDQVDVVFDRLDSPLHIIYEQEYSKLNKNLDSEFVKRIFVKTALNYEYSRFLKNGTIKSGSIKLSLGKIRQKIIEFCELIKVDSKIWLCKGNKLG